MAVARRELAHEIEGRVHGMVTEVHVFAAAHQVLLVAPRTRIALAETSRPEVNPSLVGASERVA